MRFTGLRPIEKNGLKGFGFSIHFPDQRGTNGPSLPVETATEERTACLSRPDPFEKPGSSSGPATAAPGANPSQALGAPVEPGAAGANATAASFSGRE